jgi:hypothetical protein
VPSKKVVCLLKTSGDLQMLFPAVTRFLEGINLETILNNNNNNNNNTSKTSKQTPWPESTSELYRPSDRRLSAKLVSTFADRGCLVVSATDPYGRILGFLGRNNNTTTNNNTFSAIELLLQRDTYINEHVNSVEVTLHALLFLYGLSCKLYIYIYIYIYVPHWLH